MDSTSPRRGEKASYYSAVCWGGGGVDGTSATFLMQLKERHPGPLSVIWDNAPAHRGEAVREYLRALGLTLQPMNLPGYSPDFNRDAAIWGWAREAATGNKCLGTKVKVQERVSHFHVRLFRRKKKGKGEAALQNNSAIKGSSLPARLSA